MSSLALIGASKALAAFYQLQKLQEPICNSAALFCRAYLSSPHRFSRRAESLSRVYAFHVTHLIHVRLKVYCKTQMRLTLANFYSIFLKYT